MKGIHLLQTAAWLLAAMMLFLPGLAGDAGAEERIESFSAEIAVQADASLLVKETMQVTAEGKAVRHGIFRSVPVLSWHGRRLRTFGVELVEARMDGAPAPCRTERGSLLTTFYIGDPGREISRGGHEFELVYRTTGHVRRDAEVFTLRLDATGSAWSLPVGEALAVLRLPEGGELEQASAFLARGGSPVEECAEFSPLAFAPERQLQPGESLVVEASWRGAAMALPGPSLRERLGSWGPQALAAAGLAPLVCLALLLLRGRGLRKPVAVPLFSPPEGLSPGLAACIAGKEANAVQADLLWLQARGFARMAGKGADWSILPAWPRLRHGGWQDQACLALADGLFAGRTQECSLRLDAGMPRDWRPAGPADRERIARVLDGLQSGRHRQMKAFSSPSWPLALAGFAVNAAMLCAAMYIAGWPGIYNGESLGDYVFGIAVGALVAVLPLAPLRRRKGALKVAAAVLFGSLSVLVLGWMTDWELLWWLPAASCAFAPLVFWLRWPEWPTPRGLAAQAAVDGLAMYVGAAEKDRIALAGVPADTPAQYGQMLPYAVALGMAGAWRRRFAPVLAGGAGDGAQDDFPFDARSAGPAAPDAGVFESALAAASACAAAYGASQRDGGDGGFDGGDGGGDTSGGGGGGGW